ncbi:MAG TPA: selenocysteine-specific translation elongation factor [Candidatus Limnocylindrales bacterium]|jgi:selenocysteine-specific elongation factor
MTTVVVGTAGHIDHGKTTLLRELTGIDADRLPEEQRRGMTIDVGYAHLTLPDGSELDFVDVPGHDRLVGNMLVGAGEIDAAILVVAADDGPRAQTIEHLELLDALGIASGIAVVTKTDLVTDARVDEVVGGVTSLLESTALAGSPVVPVSSHTGHGLDVVREALLALRDRARVPGAAGARLAVDRVFTVKGRGTVVTGTLRGSIAPGDRLRLVPGDGNVRVREVQVHGRAVERSTGGRTALNLASVDPGELHRGMVLTTEPEVRTTDRLLVSLRPSMGVHELPRPGHRLRVHLGTAAIGVEVGRRKREFADLVDGRRVVVLRLDRPIAAAAGDRFALRRSSAPHTAGGGVVLDAEPPRGPSRRRFTTPRLLSLASATAHDDGPRLELHGILDGRPAPDIVEALHTRAIAATSGPARLATLRGSLVHELRRQATVDGAEAARIVDRLLEGLVTAGRLRRSGDRIHAADDDDPGSALHEVMARLEAILSGPAPPPLAEAAAAADCPHEGIRTLETTGRIVRVEDDLAWSASTYHRLTSTALELADRSALTPAAMRDATGTSRRYVLAILEDLGRKGILTRTPAGHVRGPRAPRQAGTMR